MSIRSDFPAVFKEFIFNRACAQVGVGLHTDPEYQESAQEANRLCCKIANTLGDKRDLVLDMEAALGCVEGVAMERAYAQGLHDGISMLKELNLLGTGLLQSKEIKGECVGV